MKRLLLGILLISALVLSGCIGETATKTTAYVPAITVSAATLIADFEANEIAADLKYENKILRVSGIVMRIGKDILDDPYVVIGSDAGEFWGIQCMFNSEYALVSLREGRQVTIEGKCTGYFISAMLRNCVIKQ